LLGRGAALGAPFPWLIKLLDVQDRLSVQVHPDDETARRLRPGESGKTECWLVLDAAPGSYVWAGLRPGVDEPALRAALGAGRLLECLAGFSPQPGDCLLLPAGTVHAVGGGVLLAEVQQTSDVTFRLYDWDRRDAQGKARPLHLSEALASIAWRQGPVQPIPIPAFRNHPGQRQRLPLVRCPYFHLAYLADTQPFLCGGQGRLEALLVVGGRGRLVHAEGEETLLPGQAWLLPAAMSAARCLPEEGLGMVLCSLPGTSPGISRFGK
jgi:mannose-6-phosphate isomerase